MKKMIKLSLVAAVAVAGLSTSAVAGSLEEAIKGATISGKLAAEYETHSMTETGKADSSTNVMEYDFDATLNVPVNDMVTAQIGVQADHDQDIRDQNVDESQKTDDNEEANTNTIELTKLNFTFKTDMATAIVGKQKQPTPFLDDERGNGVVALIPAGPVTLAAGHFTGMNGGFMDLEERDISAIALLGAAGPVNFNAWYVTLSGATDAATVNLEAGATAYSVGADIKAGPATVSVNHASAELDGTGTTTWDAETLTKVVASINMDTVNVIAGFGMTNDTDDKNINDRYHGVDLTKDNDAAANMAMEIANLDDFNDASAYLIGASAKLGETTVGANFLALTSTTDATDKDATELDMYVSHAMSKNFTMTAKYAMLDMDTTTAGVTTNNTDDALLLNLTYKF